MHTLICIDNVTVDFSFGSLHIRLWTASGPHCVSVQASVEDLRRHGCNVHLLSVACDGRCVPFLTCLRGSLKHCPIAVVRGSDAFQA